MMSPFDGSPLSSPSVASVALTPDLQENGTYEGTATPETSSLQTESSSREIRNIETMRLMTSQ